MIKFRPNFGASETSGTAWLRADHFFTYCDLNPIGSKTEGADEDHTCTLIL